MFADKALRCECGYEVQASDEAARVDEVRRHASVLGRAPGPEGMSDIYVATRSKLKGSDR